MTDLVHDAIRLESNSNPLLHVNLLQVICNRDVRIRPRDRGKLKDLEDIYHRFPGVGTI